MDTVIVTVSGQGRFPVDMFRYDRCFPASENDSYLIMDTFSRYSHWTVKVAKHVDKAKKDWKSHWMALR